MAKERFGTQLRRRAWRAVLSYAFFRWENALLVALTVLLGVFYPRPFAWWPAWGWWALGGVAEVLFLVAAVTDEEAGRVAVMEMLRQEFDPKRVRTPKYRAYVQRALEYRARLEQMARQQGKVLGGHLEGVVHRVDDWVAQVYRLALRLDLYTQDVDVRQSLKGLPEVIKELERRYAAEDDEAVKEQIKRTLEARRSQLETLQRLQNAMEQAAYQLETTMAAMETLYSQMLLLDAQDVKGGRAQRMNEEIAEQIAALRDLAEAMDEVYQSRTR